MPFFLGWPPAVTKVAATNWLTAHTENGESPCSVQIKSRPRDRKTFPKQLLLTLSMTGAEIKTCYLMPEARRSNSAPEPLWCSSQPCGDLHNSTLYSNGTDGSMMKRWLQKTNPERKDDKLKSGGHSLIYCHKNDFEGKFNTIWF